MDARSDSLACSNEQFRLLVDAVQEYAIYMLDVDGRVSTWNAGAERIKGYSAAEVIGRSFAIFYTDDDRRLGKPSESLQVARVTGSFVGEGWRRKQDGTEFWASVVITAIYDAGELIGYAKVTRDMTIQKLAETAILDAQQNLERKIEERTRELDAVYKQIVDSRQRYESILDSISAVMWRWDTSDNSFQSVPSWPSYTGMDIRELDGWDWVNAIHPAERQLAIDRFRLAIREETAFAMEYRLRRHDGSYRDISSHGVPIRNEDGAVVDWVGICIDITERRKIEEQLRQSQKLEAVGQLAGGIAHDFNNLLTVILSYAELIHDDRTLPNPTRQMLAEILDAGQRAASLTHQFLVFSRQTVLELKPVDVNLIVTDMDSLLRRTIGEDINLKSILDDNVAQVRADPGQLGQVILNLAVNARDAMPTGGQLTIETKDVLLQEQYVNTHIEVEPGRYVLLSVSDNGAGMAPEVRSRIFEPFFTTKPPGKGTGLGLSVVHGIVSQFGGKIGAYSEPGLGTVFKIYLPVVLSGMTPPTPRVESPDDLRGSESILIVDDDPAVLRVASVALREYGYTVHTASVGADAIAIANSERIDLLISDVVMPGVSGPQLVAAILQLQPQIRVLYSSGYTDDAVVRHGLLDAEVNFLQKPFTPRSLCEKVTRVLATPAS